ncbi:MAG: HlyD family secretion protein [Nevskia sp.]|nr:HlyD family secretion protein [Nevskia sp.]
MATTAAAPEASESTSPLRRLLRLAVLLTLLAATAIFGWRWWQVGRFIESTDNAYVRADISVLSPRVGGEIVALKARDNQKVAVGDLLLQIDDRDYRARVDSARAAVAEARAALAGNGQQRSQQDAAISEVRAQQLAAQASERQAAQELSRAQTLLRDGVATRQRLDNAEAAHQSAKAGVARAAAAVQAAERALTTLGESSRTRLEAALAAAEAQLSLAEIDLAATSLKAPVAGTVGDLSARLGERVQPGQRLLSLVPLDQLYVEANFKETQLRQMQVGQPVELEFDAFPGQPLKGRVDSFSPASGAEFALLPAQNATGNFTKIVQRVPVRIVLEAGSPLAERLRPGLSVEVSVDTRNAAH